MEDAELNYPEMNILKDKKFLVAEYFYGKYFIKAVSSPMSLDECKKEKKRFEEENANKLSYLTYEIIIKIDGKAEYIKAYAETPQR